MAELKECPDGSWNYDCPSCEFGDLKCENNNVMECTGDGTWQLRLECTSEQVCWVNQLADGGWQWKCLEYPVTTTTTTSTTTTTTLPPSWCPIGTEKDCMMLVGVIGVIILIVGILYYKKMI